MKRDTMKRGAMKRDNAGAGDIGRKLRGVWATLLLDVNEDGSPRMASIDEQLQALAHAGVDGVYAHGTAGEFHLLADPMFESISIRFSENARALGLPFQIGASHPLPRQALERVAFASELRPLAIQVTLPDWTAIDTATASRFLAGCADAAGDIPLVLYNPPHARTVLDADALVRLCDAVPTLAGLKCGGGNGEWYRRMEAVLARIAVFIPGHAYASGVLAGAHGSCSNMACLDPAAAVVWARQTETDPGAARDLERRVAAFMDDAIAPILNAGWQGFVCDKAMAAAGGWTRISARLLWPHEGVDGATIERIRLSAARHIPEFARNVDAREFT